ncbi:MAG: XdhC family protein [Candidatus Eisenbacteria bacterium]
MDGESVGLATVIRSGGSTPRIPGARMAVTRGGRTVETVGGGGGEKDVIDAAIVVMGSGRPAVVHLEMWGSESEGPAMVCGGFMDVLVEPLSAAKDLEWVEVVTERRRAGREVCIVRRLREGDPAECEALLLMDEKGDPLWSRTASEKENPPLPGRGAIHFLSPVGEEEGRMIERVSPPERLVIVGAGHVGSAACEVLSTLGFEITVVDEREEFARPERFPRASRVIAGDPGKVLEELGEDPEGYYVLLGHGYPADVSALRVLLRRKHRYVGMIGSRRRVETVKRILAKEGFDETEMERIYGPIGLEIEAQTPAEIAVSIAAEIVAVRRNALNPGGSISRGEKRERGSAGGDGARASGGG